ncbi:reticulon-4-interacting protein 1 homolog, mitochondrial-like [Penaeus japonicus]|uniref:reticulon-4-interacting protein 1 homolog, mitochondrial-like n=1 Tax=Penaeus japonicus TaxID=27405 RepID=UPI001C71665A|nr:reticulon-4-interacting protein 1 homolog, mitochondrial-like [Penaeus japonicus]XP_042873764.1 reticulon-4-interacting protein 1 homolog, mitochondrial-like [Penaeus japonicus]
MANCSVLRNVITNHSKTQALWIRLFGTSCKRGSTQTMEAPAAVGYRMKAWQSNGYDGVEGLSLNVVRVPPILRPWDVLVKVQAASVNPIDTAVINGYGEKVLNIMRALGRAEQGIFDINQIEFPLTVGRDFSGEIIAVGKAVENVAVGDQVWGVVSPQRQGSHAEYVVAAASNVCSRPTNITSEEAASIPYAGLTAWSTVVVSGLITQYTAPRTRVLLLGASGGVGSFMCQMLSVWGAQVVAVCSEDALEMVTSLGAVEALDYRNPETKELLIADQGFDVVINAAGADDLDYLKALKPWMGSSYVTLSPPFLRNTDELGILPGFLKSLKQVACRNVTSLSEGKAYKWAFYMPNPFALKEISNLMSKNKIRPVIDKVFPFEAAPDAYGHVINGRARGKTVISL